MKISSIRRFVLEDFPSESRTWLGKLIQPLNQFLDQSITALQNNLTINDNFKAKRYDLTIQVNQVYPIKLAYPLNERPTMVLIGNLTEDTGSPTAPANAPYVWWEYSSNGLEVTMVGLDAAKRYKIILLAIV